MTNTTHRKIVLRNRPVGEPKPGDFELVESALPTPGPGQMLRRTLYLSLDPYMRGRIGGRRSYARPVEIGEVIVGGTVSEVVASTVPGFAAGDFVLGQDGWQSHAVSDATGLRKLDPKEAPISTALGVLGMPGLTAYVGLLDIGQPKAGETVVVSAAAGAVGSVAGQIAKIQGCRVVGVAGSPAKCAQVVDELGFDACVSYRAPDFKAKLAAACPDGIDIYFENVGGAVLDAVLELVNKDARIPLCGLIAHYNEVEAGRGPNWRPLLFNRVLLKGFIVSDHLDRQRAFLIDSARWIREGRIRYREDIAEGLERAPQAFIGLLRGENLGKQLVRVSPDPTR